MYPSLSGRSRQQHAVFAVDVAGTFGMVGQAMHLPDIHARTTCSGGGIHGGNWSTSPSFLVVILACHDKH
jgi:hypothetical protein